MSKEKNSYNIKKMSITFFCGVAIPFLIFIILGLSGIIPPTKSALILSKWNVSEPDSNTLLIKTKDQLNDTPITIGIELNGETNLLERVGITINKRKGNNPTFAYWTKGCYQAPSIFYGCADVGLVWRDLNADGCFDQRLDYPRQKMEININDRWVEGIGTQSIQTDKGNFIFDVNSGIWHLDDNKGADKIHK